MLRGGLYAAIAEAHALAGPGFAATSAWIGAHLARVPLMLVKFYVERCGCQIAFAEAFDRVGYDAVRAVLDQDRVLEPHSATKASARQIWENVAFEGPEGAAIVGISITSQSKKPHHLRPTGLL